VSFFFGCRLDCEFINMMVKKFDIFLTDIFG